jgi:hypothetical protein
MQAFSGVGSSRYSSTWAALADIYTKDGWKGLYRVGIALLVELPVSLADCCNQGVGPSTQRAALLTASQLAR